MRLAIKRNMGMNQTDPGSLSIQFNKDMLDQESPSTQLREALKQLEGAQKALTRWYEIARKNEQAVRVSRFHKAVRDLESNDLTRLDAGYMKALATAYRAANGIPQPEEQEGGK